MKKWILFLSVLVLLLCEEQKITVKLNNQSGGTKFLGRNFIFFKPYKSVTSSDSSATFDKNKINSNIQGKISVEIKWDDIGSDLWNMFSGCQDIVSIDLSNLDTSKVKGMSNMFSGCSSLQSLDLSNFETSKVEDMSYMFNECSSLQSLDLSNFDTSNFESSNNIFGSITYLSYMNLYNYKGNDIFDSLVIKITLNICTNDSNLITTYTSLQNKNITLICLNIDETTDFESTYIETTNIYKVSKSVVWTNLINDKTSSEKVIESSLIKTNNYYKSTGLLDKSSEKLDKSREIFDKSTRLLEESSELLDKSSEIFDKSTVLLD